MRVLLATDGSECANAAVETLRSFPLPPASSVLVFSATVSPPALMDPGCAADLERCFQDIADHAVVEARAVLGERFAETDTRVTCGDPRGQIIRTAEEWRPDLIVLGARGVGAIERFVLGSVSVGVTRHATCPVLVVKGNPTETRRITIAIDRSDDALNAARFVARLPLDPSTAVHLLAVVEPPQYPTTVPDLLPASLYDAIAAATDVLRSQMEAAIERATGVFPKGFAKLTSEILVGQAAHEIVRASEKSNTDLLVVGARGVGGFSRLLLGSVSDSVLRHASCSVLVVRHA